MNHSHRLQHREEEHAEVEVVVEVQVWTDVLSHCVRADQCEALCRGVWYLMVCMLLIDLMCLGGERSLDETYVSQWRQREILFILFICLHVEEHYAIVLFIVCLLVTATSQKKKKLAEPFYSS